MKQDVRRERECSCEEREQTKGVQAVMRERRKDMWEGREGGRQEREGSRPNVDIDEKQSERVNKISGW